MTHTNISTKRRRSAGPAMVAGAAVLITLLSGCATTSPSSEKTSTDKTAAADAGATRDGGPSVMWVGDSVAKTEAPALGAALEAAGARFSDESSDGGGVMVDSGGMMSQLAQDVWGTTSKAIEETKPDTIVYQIATYDWGTPEQQKEAYQKLADKARSVGADLVIVSTPPMTIDEFYAPHAAEMATTAASANSVAEASGGTVTFLDSSALWGTDPAGEKAQRGDDGIHACQQAAASFASWFMKGFEDVSGLEPTDPEAWATGDWTSNEVFAKYDCPTGDQ